MIFIPIVIGLAVGAATVVGSFKGEEFLLKRKNGKPERDRKAAEALKTNALDRIIEANIVANHYRDARQCIDDKDFGRLKTIAALIQTHSSGDARVLFSIAKLFEEEARLAAPEEKRKADIVAAETAVKKKAEFIAGSREIFGEEPSGITEKVIQEAAFAPVLDDEPSTA